MLFFTSFTYFLDNTDQYTRLQHRSPALACMSSAVLHATCLLVDFTARRLGRKRGRSVGLLAQLLRVSTIDDWGLAHCK